MFVLDESSYRVDKSAFETQDEAKQYAAEAARILGRAINVYELLNGELMFVFRVRPDGSTDTINLSEPMPDSTLPPATQVVKGRNRSSEPSGSAARAAKARDRALLDNVADALERAGRTDLAAHVDFHNAGVTSATHGIDDGITRLARALKDKS